MKDILGVPVLGSRIGKTNPLADWKAGEPNRRTFRNNK